MPTQEKKNNDVCTKTDRIELIVMFCSSSLNGIKVVLEIHDNVLKKHKVIIYSARINTLQNTIK